MTAAEVLDHVAHFQRRVLVDALQDATRSYWLRRAAVFEWVLAAVPATDDPDPQPVPRPRTGYYPPPTGSRPSYWFPASRPEDRLRQLPPWPPRRPASERRAELEQLIRNCRHRAGLARTAPWPEAPLVTTEDEWERLEVAYNALGEARWGDAA